MCMVSNIGDSYGEMFPGKWPQYNPPLEVVIVNNSAEIEALRNEIKALKKLLLAAKKFDEQTGQPDCEMDEKVNLIRAIAKMVGVDMKDVFP